MADKIKGITIQLGGDTTNLSKALSNVNKDVRDTQTQLKDVNRLLKLDPTNTTLLEQKQRLLSEAVSGTKDKLSILKEAESQVQQQFAEGKVSQEQYDALKREIVATEAQLKNLEKAAESSNSAMDKISETAKKVSEGAGKVASATKGISTAAGGAIAGLGAMAVKAGLAADDLNTMSKQSGFDTAEIQKWQYAADRIDVSVESIVGAAGKMKKNMVSTSKDTTAAWEKLGISVTDTNGNLRNSTDVFYEAIEGLSKIQNETERDVVAMQLFGKSADSLAGIIDDGGQALREMGDEAERNGLILSQDALDGANAFNDGIDTLKAKAQQAFFASGATLAETLLPAMETLVDKGSAVLEWIAGLDSDTLTLIGTILLMVASISPVAGTISKITGAVDGVSKAIGFLMANPMVALAAGIVALVLLIATKGDEIQAVLQKVDDFMQNVFATDWRKIFGPGLGDALNAFFANLKNIWDSVMQVLNGVINFIRGVFTGDWSRAWDGVKQIFSGIFGGLVAIAKAPINAIIGMINGAISSINWMIQAVNRIPGVNIPQIGNIGYMANGGILTEGSSFVGENGPELLTISNGRAVVEPLAGNSSHTAAVKGASAGAGTVPQSPMVVQVMVDRRVLGETVIDYTRDRSRAYG